MHRLVTALVTLLMVFYPFVVAWALSHQQLLWVSLLLLSVGVIRFFVHPNRLFLPLTALAILCGSLSLILKDEFWLKFYPVLMSLGTCLIFAFTLRYPPSMIERFARLQQADLPESGVRWTRKVTQVWCAFLFFNALIALGTVWYASTWIWTIYNGFISYILMGVLLLGEFVLRKKHQAGNENKS